MTLQRLLGEGLDRLVLDAMIRLVAPGEYIVPRQEGESHLTGQGLGDPSRFFPPLPSDWTVEVREQRLMQRPRYDVTEWHMPSPVSDAEPPNDMMNVRCFTPKEGSRGRVILLHGAMASRRFPWDFMARRLAEQGLDSYVPSMPDHLERTPPGELSGQYLIGGHLQRGLEVVRQGVSDVRALVHLLRQTGDSPVGVVGFSMGGLIGGWTITLESLDFAVLAEPAVQLNPIVFDTRLGQVARRTFFQAGWDEDEIRHWLSALSPVWAESLLPPERLMLVLPEYDGFVPPQAVEQAWQRWGRPELARYPAGHISLYLMRQAWQDIVQFLDRWCPRRGNAEK